MVGQINHHLYRKRGFYYFCRRVPKALLEHYPKPRIVVALKTRQFRDALRQSQIISKRLDDQWFHMQLDAMGLDNVQSKLFQPVKPSAPLMSEATSFYLRLKGEGKDKVFVRAAQRNAASVIEVLGDRPINDYASSEAGKLRDALLDRGLAVTSIKRMFGSVKAIINLAMAELGIEGRNPFASIFMPDEMPEERQPIPLDAIRRIQHECMAVDDENRWPLALISDTGMRLSEAVGLARDDIVLDADIPHVIVRPHPWRRLKTKGSERLVPPMPSMHHSKMAGVQHEADATCPRFMQFLADIFPDDEELMAYVQKVAGYLLTGSTKEQCLFMLLGGGANGKSTLVNLLTDLLGDYAANTAASTLMASNSNQYGDDLIRLAGARLITSSETEHGQELNLRPSGYEPDIFGFQSEEFPKGTKKAPGPLAS